MSRISTKTDQVSATRGQQAGPGPGAMWRDRVEAADWDAVRADLDRYGCGLTGPLLTPEEAAQLAGLYVDEWRFRSTVDMSRHRFGAGEYRYFAEPFPRAGHRAERGALPEAAADRPQLVG